MTPFHLNFWKSFFSLFILEQGGKSFQTPTMPSLAVYLLLSTIIGTASTSCITRSLVAQFQNFESSLKSFENSYLGKCGKGTEYSSALDEIAVYFEKIQDKFHNIYDILNNNHWKRYDGHCYVLTAEQLTWEKAEKRCKVMNSSLVTIDEKSEGTWLQQEMSHFGGNFWIGLSADEYKFYWNQNKQPKSYHQFPNGYPTISSARCVYTSSSGSWYNTNCDNKYHFICEKKSCTGDGDKKEKKE